MTETYSEGDEVWYRGQFKATVIGMSSRDDHKPHYTLDLETQDENITTHAGKIEDHQTRLNENLRDPFGGIEVNARGNVGMASSNGHINFSIPAQGAGEQLTPEQAREVAQGLRDGSEGLAHILDDDPEEAAEAFEKAAEMVEEFKAQGSGE